jgi:hypothetical protein
MLRGDDGTAIDLQVDAGGTATFVERNLPKGSTKTYRIVPANTSAKRPRVEAVKEGKVVKFSVDGKPVLHYQAEPGELPRPEIKPLFKRGGYIHPI